MISLLTNKTTSSIRLKLLAVLVLLFISGTAAAQNTKGDKPSSSRENRFKTSPRKPKGGGAYKPASPKKIGSGPGYTPRGRARGGERAGKPLRPVFNVDEPKEKQRAWKGDLTGRKIRSKNQNSEKYKPPVYRQTGPNVKRRVPDREGRQNVARGRAPKIPTATGKVRNVYPQKGPYVSNPHSVPRREPKPVSNRTAIARLKKMQTGDKLETGGGGDKRVKPRSASRPFMRSKSINVWANFKRPKKKPVKAQTTDIAGRRIRGRNYETPKPGLIKAPNTYHGRISGKDRAYTGAGGYNKTATRRSQAWVGDIAGRGIRHRDKTSKRSVEGRPFSQSRPKSVSGKRRTGMGALPVKQGGYGLLGLGSAGKGRRADRRVNTSGIAVKSKGPVGFTGQGVGFAGSSRARRPYKGGGSVSGKFWNNRGNALAPRIPKRADLSGLPGNYRAKRPLTGGGSVSGKLWNNKGQALSPRIPKRADLSGLPNLSRARKPLTGGGSVSGKLWNNRERALPPRIPKNSDLTGLPGNYRAQRPAKGGGSVSGKLWNNKEKPLAKRTYKNLQVATFRGNMRAQPRGETAQDRRMSGYQGNRRLNEAIIPLGDQGEEFEGNKKLPKFRRTYIQNKLAAEESLKKRRPEKEAFGVEGLQTKVKRRSYVRNKDVSADALMKLKQTSTDERTSDLQVKVQRRDYVRNKNLPETAMKKLKPTASDQAVSGTYGKIRQYHYVRNPSSAQEALKVREPGKAFARASDYQGNIKMQKYSLLARNRGLHPDAQFVKTNKNNVKQERDAVTNLKLWWARLFKKQETQPEHLKEKLKKPRYDKGEIGLWYD